MNTCMITIVEDSGRGVYNVTSLTPDRAMRAAMLHLVWAGEIPDWPYYPLSEQMAA